MRFTAPRWQGSFTAFTVVHKQLIGADGVLHSLSAFHLLPDILDGVFEVLERDLFRLVPPTIQILAHSIIDGADIVQNASVIRFHAIRMKPIAINRGSLKM